MKKILFTIILLTSVLFTFAQTNLTVTNVNSTDVTVNWDDGGCTNANYQFRYKEASTPSWPAAPPTITIPNTGGSQSYILNGLNTATTYNWRIKCGNNGNWEYGPDFTTLNCNMSSSIDSITNTSCGPGVNTPGNMDGNAFLTVTGGTSPYTFSWDNGYTTQNLSGVLAGTYSVIITDNLGCTDTAIATIGIIGGTSIQQNISDFLPNPVTAYNQWSYDTLQMENTGCEVRVRPEFEVSCSAGNIQQGDLTIKWTIPGQAGGINIPYTINANGNAEGFWSQIAGDSTGYLLPYSGNYTLVVKVKFSNPPGTAQYGIYTAYWETFEVDNLGNKIGSLSPQDAVSLSFIDYCAIFSIDSVSSDSTSCPGGNNGLAEVITITNGSGNYTYSWSNGATTNPATNLSVGTYSVIVTDTTYNCSDTSNITVIDGSGSSTILDSVSGTNISCNGLLNGSAEVIINTGGGGGGGSFTGSYCSSGPTQDFYSNIELVQLIGDVGSIINNTAGACDMYEDYTTMSTTLTAGQSYSMRVDLNTCDPAWAFVDAAKIFIDWNIDGDFDDLDEEIQLVGPVQSPSTHTFSFTVPSSAISGNTRMRVVAENYTYNGNSTSFGPCQIAPPNTNWFGATEDYSLVINAPTISATYLWNNGDTTSVISGLATGPYWCIVSDENNCSTTTDTIFISEPSAIFIEDSITYIQCYGDSTGSIDISVSGGINPYTYLWNNGSTTQDLSNITAGTYSVTVTDNNGCVDSITVTLTEPNPINLSITGVVDILCAGDSTGSIDISVSGGINPYTYLWNNGSTTQDLSNITAGTYNLTVTDSNGCVDSITITLTEPSVLNSIITPTHVTSCVIFNGSIALTVTGGVPSYTYSWTGPSGFTSIIEDLSNLSGGNYSVIITDTNNCTTTNNTIIEQPSNGLTIDTLVSLTYNGYNISCNGGNNGNITATASGGLGNLSFAWTGTGGPYSTQNLTNIEDGTYSVTVTDSLGCSVSDNITLNEPSELSSVYSTTNVLCNGDSTGGANVVFSGGVYWTTPPLATYVLSWTGYTYPLLNGNTTFITPFGVPAGIYPYSATDGNGCMHFDTITITEPTAITISSSTTNVSCFGLNDGSVSLSISGGIPTYIEYWGINNPMALAAGIYNYTVTDANLCVNSGSVTITEPTDVTVSSSTTNVSCNGGNDGTATLTLIGGTGTLTEYWGINNPMALAAGIYNYTVTDANLCVNSGSVTITEPSEITITNSVIDVSVYNGNDGSINISVSGGINPYTYLWSNGSTTQDLYNITAGNYIITVTDAANCSNSDTIFVDQPSTLSISIDTVINIICFGACNGKIDITPDGGDSVYTYLWTGPNGFSSTNEDLDSLCSGTYELIISDTTSSISATIDVVEPIPFQIITNIDTVLCYGGTAQASAFTYGGQHPYSTLWDNGDSSITTYLSAGIHYVNVTDSNDCFISDTFEIIQNDSMSISTDNDDISCYGLTNGSIQINVDSGGTPGYSYSDNNGQSFQSSSTFYNLGVGLYNFIVMDSNGCTNSVSGRISEPEELVVTLSPTHLICHGDSNGTAIANISGGTSPYIIDTNWGGLDPNNLSAGLVNVTVTDSNGCLSTNFVIITELNNPVIVMITVNGTTLEADTGFLSYQWIDDTGDTIIGETSQSYTPTSSGEYYVKVVDSNGCIGESIKINFIIESVGYVSSHLNIYPNPTNSWVIIETKVEINSDIKILNIFGKVVETIDYKLFNDKFEKINMSKFSKGIYIIQLINNQSIINHKIILQ